MTIKIIDIIKASENIKKNNNWEYFFTKLEDIHKKNEEEERKKRVELGKKGICSL